MIFWGRYQAELDIFGDCQFLQAQCSRTKQWFNILLFTSLSSMVSQDSWSVSGLSPESYLFYSNIVFFLVLILSLLLPESKNEMTPCQFLGQVRTLLFLKTACLAIGSLFLIDSYLNHKSDKFHMLLNRPWISFYRVWNLFLFRSHDDLEGAEKF